MTNLVPHPDPQAAGKPVALFLGYDAASPAGFASLGYQCPYLDCRRINLLDPYEVDDDTPGAERRLMGMPCGGCGRTILIT